MSAGAAGVGGGGAGVGGGTSSGDGQVRQTASDRPLNAILEDPDEGKSVTTDAGSFFFEDDDDESSISIPKFTPLSSSAPTRITFANSSFNSLITKQSAAESSIAPRNPMLELTDFGSVDGEANLIDIDSKEDVELYVNQVKFIFTLVYNGIMLFSIQMVLLILFNSEDIPEYFFYFFPGLRRLRKMVLLILFNSLDVPEYFFYFFQA